MGKRVVVGETDLSTTHPALVTEWDVERNAPLTPQEVSKGSDRKVFWICPEGHSYDASISSRSSRGRGCPYCAGKRVLVGFNDLAATHPDIVAEWDVERNAPLTPQEVSRASHKKIFWKCQAGHSFLATVASRTAQGSGCSYCVGQGVSAGFNDLATTHPALVTEWDVERNAPLTPQEVSKGSGKKVYWVCPEGHSYLSLISSRTSQQLGCPICAGKRVLAGFNDLATTHPDIAVEWDVERNAPLTPQEVSKGSDLKVFWVCPKGHSYQTSIVQRTSSLSGCRKCVQRRVAEGVNDIGTTHPELVAEWDFNKNKQYSPQELSSGSDLKVFWLCPEGHSYFAPISSRSLRGRGCPYCVGQSVSAGFNDLATTHPDIAAEWDVERNAPLTPQEVSKGSGKKVYWVCPEGHSYQTRTAERTSGKSCPVCANKTIVPGVNDLATFHPDIAAEWDVERNAPLTPQEVSRASVKKVYWVCPEGHSYQSSIASRSNQQTGCPICAGKRVLAGFNDLATTHPDIAAEWDYSRNAPLLPTQISAGIGKSYFWVCPEGHSYRSVVGSRTNIGTGCPNCNVGGFDATQSGLFYFIKSETLRARKVGITNVDRRYDRIASYGAEWEIILTIQGDDGQIIRDLETTILRWLRKEKGLPAYLGKEEMGRAGGHTETFTLDLVPDEEVLLKITEVFERLSSGTLNSTNRPSNAKKILEG